MQLNDKNEACMEGLSLYELNKNIIANLPLKTTIDEMTEMRQTIDDFCETLATTNFMLLCRDISYFTVFQKQKIRPEFGTLGCAVLECAQDVGKIICTDLTEAHDAIEIWVRTENNDNLCMYLFDCDKMIVTYGR